MAMKLPMPPTQAPRRGLPRTSGSLSTAVLRILARPFGDSASPAISDTTFERSRMPPLESMIPGFSRPRGPKRTSFMDSPRAEGGDVAPGGAIMRRAPAAGKKCAHAAGQHSLPQKCVKEATNAPPICCRTATNAEILRKLARLGGFSFAIGTLRGQDYPHAPSPRAKLQATRGQGPTHDGRSAPQDTAGSMGLIGGCDGAGASRPRSRLGPQIAPGKTPPSMSRFCPVM